MILDIITTIDWPALIAAFTTIGTGISTVVAIIQNRNAKEAKDAEYKAEKEAIEQNRYANEVQAFFDPTNNQVMTPPEGTPDRAWKMSNETKQFILSSGNHSAEEKTDILKQIDEAEKAGYVDYRISYAKGYYNITYGLLNGGAQFEK